MTWNMVDDYQEDVVGFVYVIGNGYNLYVCSAQFEKDYMGIVSDIGPFTEVV